MRSCISLFSVSYFCFFLLFSSFLAYSHSHRRHVHPDGDDNNDGLSWAHAMRNVQPALDASSPGDEVWVAAGCYEATQRTPHDGETAWFYSFMLRDGVHVYGGFAGHEQTITERARQTTAPEPAGKWSFAAETILTLPPETEGRILTASELCFQHETIIDGFTLTGGKACGRGDAGLGGGALLPGKAILKNCQITNNLARTGGGLTLRAAAEVHYCVISDNDLLAEGWGGLGGGMRLLGDGALVTNSLIIANGQNGEVRTGGGISAEGAGIIINCTIVGNTALRQGSGVSLAGIGGQLHNSIIWGNFGSLLQVSDGDAIISHCGITAGPTNNGNIPLEADNCGWRGVSSNDNWVDGYYVCFIDAANRDFRLGAGSYLINRGQTNPQHGTRDAAGAERCQNGNPDIGAFESTWLGNLAFDFAVESPCLYRDPSSVVPFAGLATPAGVNVSFRHEGGSIAWSTDHAGSSWSALWLSAGTASPVLEVTATGQQAAHWHPFTLMRSLQVKPRPLVIAADDQHYTWEEPFPDFTWQIIAGRLADGDTISGELTSDYAGVLEQTYTISKGTLQIDDGSQGSNYLLTFWPGSLSCHKAIAALDVINDSFTYDSQPINFAWESNPPGLTGIIACSGFDKTPHGSTSELPIEAGTYLLNITLDDPHYRGETAVQIRIDQAPLAVTAVDCQRQFGIDNPDFTLHYEGFCGADTTNDITSPQISTDATATSPIGNYPICLQGGQARNYRLLLNNGTLKITPASLNIDLAIPEMTYGDLLANQAIACQAVHCLTGAPVNGTFQWLAGHGEYLLPAGTHQCPWTFWPESANYAIASGEATININKAELLVTAPHLEILAGMELPILELTYQGFVAAENEMTPGVFARLPTITCNATNDSPPGKYQIQIMPGEADNYAATYHHGWLEIKVADPILKQMHVNTIFYGERLQAAKLAAVFQHPVTEAIINGSLQWQYPDSLLPAGVHTCTWIFTPELAEHYQTLSGQAEVTILPRALIVAAVAVEKFYGAPDPAFSWVFSSGSMSLIDGDQCPVIFTRVPGEMPGQYDIQPSCPGLSSNYTVECLPAQLSIVHLPITVKLLPIARQYGDPDPWLPYEIVSGALLPGDSFSGTLSREPGDLPGTYATNPGDLSLPAYYQLRFITDGQLNIVPRHLSVTIYSWNKLHGDPDPPWQYEITAGSLLPGDLLQGAPAREAGETTGKYAILGDDLHVNDFYAITCHCGKVTILPRDITVQADDQWRFPLMPNPTLTYRITAGGLVAGDNFSGELSTTTTTALGTYAIKQGTLTLNDNYKLHFLSGQLKVIPPIITDWTAEASAITYGQPLADSTPSGVFLHPQTGEPVPGTLQWLQPELIPNAGIQQHAACFYPDTSTWLEPVQLHLPVTVQRIRLKVVGTSYEAVWGDPFTDDNGFQYKIVEGALLPGDYPTGSLSCNIIGNVGCYTISMAGLRFPSYYDVELLPGTLTIHHRHLTIQAHNLEKLQNHSDPVFTYDIINGPITANVFVRGQMEREFGEAPGVYRILQGTLTIFEPNCILHFLTGTFTIHPHSLPYIVKAEDINFGDSLAAATLSKVQGFDNLADGELSWLNPDTIVPIGIWPQKWKYVVDNDIVVQGWCNVKVYPTRTAVIDLEQQPPTRGLANCNQDNAEDDYCGWGIDVFSTLEEAIDAVATGGEIRLYPGKHFSPTDGWLIERDLTLVGVTDNFSESVSLFGHFTIEGEQVFDVSLASIALWSPPDTLGISIAAPNASIFLYGNHLKSEATTVQVEECHRLWLYNNTFESRKNCLTIPLDWQWPATWLQENAFIKEIP